MNYYNLVQDLIEYNPGKFRFNCPGCGRQNSLAVYRQDGELSFHCYGNGCNVRGKQRQRLSVADIYNRKNKKIAEEQEFVCPDYWTQGLNREEVREYLQSVHCLEAAIDGRVQIRYDPKQNRAVFLIYNGNELVNATGRALTKGIQPKWYIYGQQRYPLICGNHSHAFIVEDCASAARISKWATGISLCGTDLVQSFIGKLRKYKRVMICLDKDALRKALKMERELTYFADVTIALLDEDLKNLDNEHCKEFLGRYIDVED